MKKGFTLIELLAVIIILAIISLIAVPIIINIIDDVRMKKATESFNNVISSSKLYMIKNQLNDEKIKI